MKKDKEQKPQPERKEALPERLLRRVFEGMGAVVDRGLGRSSNTSQGGLTTSALIQRMKHLIDERARVEDGARVAPHHLKLKIEWGTHSEAPPEIIQELEHEILAAAIDYINDNRYSTLAPVTIEAEVDIFT